MPGNDIPSWKSERVSLQEVERPLMFGKRQALSADTILFAPGATSNRLA